MADKNDNQPFGLCKNDADFLKYFHNLLKDIRSLVISNIEYYQRGKSSIHACFYASFCILLERTQVLEPLVINIVPKLQDFDFSEDVQANGYRSFISIVNRCCIHLLQLSRHININKTSLLFRSTHYLKELEAYVEVLGQLMACLGYLQQLISYSKSGNLFLEDNEAVGDDLLIEVEMLNTDCFYGRCLGFQFSESMQKVLHTVVVAMATYSECYEESSQVIQIASSLLNGSKYIMDDELRAKQVVDITRTEDIKFCKAFWSITDSPVVHKLRSFIFPHVEVSEVISLEPENFELPMDSKYGIDDTVTITPPCAHTGLSPVKVRLISHAVREGMSVTRNRFQPKTGSKKPEILPKSPGLLFHCHGGGFVAQSSQSHENYLRVWTKKLEMPILSVDYALAPESPFPRGLEESFYAYAWALKNCEKLGWTGERICFAGDSAGGNIVISTALRAVSYRIRVPDGIMVAYMPSLVQYTPSPARLMAMIDPLLPVGILTRCLAAYAGIADKFSSALAKPIFCNPGKYENWEVVDESDTNTIPSEQPPVNDVNGCKSTVTSSEGKGYKSDNVDGGTVVSSQSSNIPYDSTVSVCHSIENLSDDEFVVYELDDTGNTDGAEIGVLELPIDKSNNSDNTATVTNVDTDKVIAISSDRIDEQSVHKGNEKMLENEIKETEMCQCVDVSESDSVVPNREEVCNDMNEDQCDSVDGKHLSESEPTSCDDPSMLYAVCKEILNEGTTGYEDNGTAGYDNTNMDCSLCHSLEDLDEADMYTDMMVQSSVDDTVDEKIDCLNNKVSLSKGADLSTKLGACRKQLSVSDTDTNDSGILGDCCTDQPDSVQDVTLISTQCKQIDESTNTVTQSNTENISSAEISGKTADHTKPDKHTMNRTQMSLDLPVSYHPVQETAEVKSPVRKISPVSPQLSPGKRSFTPKLFSVQRKIAQSPIQLFRHLPIVKNMYMSPLLAPDELLTGLPPVHLTACHFDPLLDDSVMFAKKLSKLGGSVTLKVFDDLPHGFLSFSDASPEARQASLFCVERIQQVLKPNEKF